MIFSRRIDNVKILTKRRRADQSQFYTILHNKYASYAHNDGVGQSIVQQYQRQKRKITKINKLNWENGSQKGTVTHCFNPVLKCQFLSFGIF